MMVCRDTSVQDGCENLGPDLARFGTEKNNTEIYAGNFVELCAYSSAE